MISRTTKAARFYDAGKPLVLEEVPIPELGPRDVLVDIKASGICGTDVHIALEGSIQPPSTPITLGHEASGVIAEVGVEVIKWKVGDRVSIYPQEACGECYWCRSGQESRCTGAKVLGLHIDGGFAEYLKVAARSLIRLPVEIPFEQGAIVPDAVATPFHAITARGGLQAGETVAIFGCGGLGIHGIRIAKLCGASKIIAVDVSEGALERAREAGADYTVNAGSESPARKIRSLTNGRGVDLSLEFVGLQTTIDQSVKSLQMGGKAVIVGIGPQKIETLPPSVFVYGEYQLIGSFGSNIADVEKVIRLVASGRLDLSRSITAKLPLEEINTGLERLQKKIGNPIRIVVSKELS
ncbi:MAG: zinc-binding dehydrogenase [Candidatus Binatia bacterium]